MLMQPGHVLTAPRTPLASVRSIPIMFQRSQEPPPVNNPAPEHAPALASLDSQASQGLRDILAFQKTFPQYGPPTFNPAFHQDRRQQFLAKLPPNSVVVVVGGEEFRRNNDVNYPFRQQNDFYYLTGFDEPDSVAVFQNVPEIGRAHV